MSGFVFDSQKLDYKDLRDIDKYMLAELAAFAKQTQLHYDNYDIEKGLVLFISDRNNNNFSLQKFN
jgi:isoleucyl-tRNA synthetase